MTTPRDPESPGSSSAVKLVSGVVGGLWLYCAERLLDGDPVHVIGQVYVWLGLAVGALWLLPPTRSLVERAVAALDLALHRLTGGRPADTRLQEQVAAAKTRVVPQSGMPQAGYHLANALTAARLLLAPFVVAAGITGDWMTMYVLFLLANLTDVLDGLVARATNGESAAGKDFDASVDTLLNFAMLLGMVVGMTRMREGGVLTLLLIAFVGFLLYRRLYAPGGGTKAKLASGAWRVVLAGVALLLLVGVPETTLRLRLEATFSLATLALLGAALFLFAGVYELWVMRAQARGARRMPE